MASFCLIGPGTSSAGPVAKTADAVYVNGNIYTVEAGQPKAQALAIVGQKLVFVGSDKGAKKYVGATTKVVDLQGKTAPRPDRRPYALHA